MSVLFYLAGLTALCGVSYSPSVDEFVGKYQISIPSTFNTVQFDYDAENENVYISFGFNYVLYLEQSNGDNIIYTATNNRDDVFSISNVVDFDSFLLSLNSISLQLNNFDIYLTGQSGIYFGYDIKFQYENGPDLLHPNLVTFFTSNFSDYLTLADGQSNHTIIGSNNDYFSFGDINLSTRYEITEDNLQYIFESGYALGYGAGYSDGERDGYTEGSSKLNGSWVDWIVEAVKGFFDTPLFGEFTLGGILTTVLGIYLMVYMLKVFAGG